MFEARQGREIVVEVKNKIGVLFEVSKVLSEKGLSILAISGTVSGEDALIRLVTDDNLRAKEALTAKGYVTEEETVVLLEVLHQPGMIKRIAERLTAENIDIRYLYATALEQHERCLLVLHTSNDEHALPKLNEVRIT